MRRLPVTLMMGALLLTAGNGRAAAAEPTVTESSQENPEYRFDFSVFGGGHFFTEDHALGRVKGDPTEKSPKHSGLLGASLGLHFNRWIGVEVEFAAVPTITRGYVTPLDNPNELRNARLWVFGYRGSFVLNLADNYKLTPFLLAGVGGLTSLSSDENVVSSQTWEFLHAGAGFKVGFHPRVGLRFDGRILVPWTAMPVIPHGSRIGYTGPDFEVFGGAWIAFSEIERSTTTIKEAPRFDGDADGVPDDVDKCPKEAEDKDGFEDNDGCPDVDNDKDDVPDTIDKCPNDPEEKDGFEDEDGCPDADNDKDGVPDGLDKCPNEPEDKDNFEDNDGCAEPDNDKDGIADAIDKCPNQPETINHYKDEDGCPDEVPAEVKKFTGVIEGINFKTNSAEILPGSWAVLDRAVKVLQDFPDVNLEISGHTDSRGRASYNLSLSQRRADSVKLYFVSRGVATSRLVSIGYGEDRPLADNSTASGRARNRRTEFKLIDAGKK